jgi:GNAT superfamily N-acetyltransferase
MLIRDPLLGEGPVLWALALRSKAAWGYSEEFMAASADELAPSDLSMAGVAVTGDAAVGFYTLERGEAQLELGHLFVEPRCWGQGIGRRLLAHASARARVAGYQEILIQGDPNARGFYERCGATCVGERASGSIPGRVLPLFVLPL